MEKFIIFTSGSQNFAVPINVTEKILKMESPTRIPDTSPYVMGMIQYKEGVLPIFDLSQRLYQVPTPVTANTKIVVVHWKGKEIGMAVDDVVAVRSFEQGDYKESKEEIREELSDLNNDPTEDLQLGTKYISNLLRTDEGIVLTLDVNSIFSREGEEELVALMDR